MKYKFIIIIFISFFLFSSCIRNAESENHTKNTKVFPKDSIDYTKIKISEDSIDIALFNLIIEHDNFSKTKLKENINTLVKKGANPNAVIEYSYSVRRLGTYIPIVKAFYRTKYRTHSANSTAFHESINSQKPYIVKELIDLMADVNTPNKDAMYPIDLALSNESEDIIDLLIKSNCNISNTNLAVSTNIYLIEKLTKLGANTETININFALNDKVILKRILELNPPVNNLELNYRHIFSDEEVLDLLLKHGLNNSTRGKFPDNDLPLVYGAIKYSDLNTIKKLEEANINIFQTKKSGNKNESPIISVVKNEKNDILNYYIEKKANVNAKDWTGKSALIFAVNTENDEIIKTLINAGANIEYTGYFNKTPLMHAIQYDKYISAQVLINEGANINYKDKYGKTCLMQAIEEKSLPMIKMLINSGANTNVKYKKMTLVEYAKSIDAQNIIIQYLEENI